MCLKLQYALNNASYGKMVIHQNGLWRGIRLCSAIFASEKPDGRPWRWSLFSRVAPRTLDELMLILKRTATWPLSTCNAAYLGWTYVQSLAPWISQSSLTLSGQASCGLTVDFGLVPQKFRETHLHPQNCRQTCVQFTIQSRLFTDTRYYNSWFVTALNYI